MLAEKNIRVDVAQAREPIMTLLQTVVDYGFVHDGILLNYLNGQMDVAVRKPPERGAKLVVLPVEVMPSIDAYHWTYQDHHLEAVLKDSVEAPPDIQRACLDAMVCLYNLTDKVEEYSRSAPAIALSKHPALLDLLNVNVAELEGMSLNEKKCHVFLESRAFATKDGLKRLLPVVDFFDHTSLADGFRFIEDADLGEALQINFHSPAILPTQGGKSTASKKKSVACMVSYQVMDAHVSFGKYGFVDDSAFFARSWPFEMTVGDESDEIKIIINNDQVNNAQFNPALWHTDDPSAPFYAANHFLHRPGELTIEFMLIPPQAHVNALDTVLKLYLGNVEIVEERAVGSINTFQNRQKIKRELIDFNRQYYETARDYVKTHLTNDKRPIVRMLIKMIKKQLKVIAEFEASVF